MFNKDDYNNITAEFYNVLEYACYDKDQCNKLFVYHHIKWLKQVNYTNFKKNLQSILFNNQNSTEYCFIDKIKLSKCLTNVCSGKYSSYHKNYLFECHLNSEALVEVHITTNMIVIEENSLNKSAYIEEHKIIRYTCKYNQCNNQLLTDKLLNITELYFELSYMKQELLNYYWLNKNQSTYSSYDILFKNQTKEFSSSI
ncbi:unnamed protein product, partial [Rotaria sp. Silwood2]